MQFFVTSFAHTDKLPFFAVPDRQGKVRPVFEVLDVVDQYRPSVPPLGLASLALIAVQLEYFRPGAQPAGPAVESVLLAGSDQSYKTF